MKRFISLIIIAFLLVFSLSVPALAAGTPEIMELLDIVSFNEDGSNAINAKPNGRYIFTNVTAFFKYIDITIRFTQPTPAIGMTFYPRAFGAIVQPIKIDDYTYRWIFSFRDASFIQEFEFMFRGDFTPCSADILSIKVSNSPFACYDCPLTGTVSYGGGDEAYFYYNNFDDYTGVNLLGSSNLNYDSYWSYIFINDWRKYDFIDLQVYLSELSLNSLTVAIDGTAVPFTVNYLNSESSLNIVAADIMLDLTNVRRDLSGPIELCFTGNVPAIDNRVGRFVVMHSYGFVDEAILNADYLLLARFKYFLSTQFSSISTWVSNQTSTLTSSISTSFSNLNTWISNQTSSLTNSISTSFNNLNSWISNQTSSLTNSISTWGQNIINALTPNTNDAEDVIDQADQQAGELQQGNQVLNNVPKPDLSDAGDISSIISPSNVASNTHFLTNLMSAPILSDVLLLSLIFALAGFVLFGKR